MQSFRKSITVVLIAAGLQLVWTGLAIGQEAPGLQGNQEQRDNPKTLELEKQEPSKQETDKEETDKPSEKLLSKLSWSQLDLPEHADWRFGQFGNRTDFNGFYDLKFSPDGTHLAARDRKHRVSILDVSSQSVVCQIEQEFISDFAFSSDNQYLLTSSDRHGKAKIWNAQTGVEEFESSVLALKCAFLEVPGREIKAVFVDGSNLTQVTIPKLEETIRKKWKVSQFADRLREFPVAINHDGRWVISCERTGGDKGKLAVFDSETGERISKWPFYLVPKKAAVSKNGRWLAAMYHRKPELRIWDIRYPSRQHFVLKSQHDTFLSFAFSDDGRFLISSDWKKNIVVWDLLTRESIVTLKGHSENVNSIASSPELLSFVTGASGRTDSSILFWNLKSHVFPYEAFDEGANFDDTWRELGSAFANKSLSATAKIVNQGDAWLPEIVKRCNVNHPRLNSDVTALIDQLKAPKFKAREWATEKLKKMANQILPLLEAAKDSSSAEVRWRIKEILSARKDAPPTNSAKTRRAHRVVLALEVMQTPEAIKCLEKFANGHSDFNVSEEASEALVRLKKSEK